MNRARDRSAGDGNSLRRFRAGIELLLCDEKFFPAQTRGDRRTSALKAPVQIGVVQQPCDAFDERWNLPRNHETSVVFDELADAALVADDYRPVAGDRFGDAVGKIF